MTVLTSSIITTILRELNSEFRALAENLEFEKMLFYKFHSFLSCKNLMAEFTPDILIYLIYYII